MNKVFKALTIAGSDSGGGAGIQADLKTFQELDVFGMTAITAVTAQNTLGVQGVYPMSVEGIKQQIQSVGEDLGADAVKTGMLFNSEIIEAVAEKINQFGWKNIVVDPVMVAKGGALLLQSEAVTALKKYLLPLAMVITPNIPETEVLTEASIHTIKDRELAANRIFKMGVKYVVIKGGHEDKENEVLDLIYDGKEFVYLSSEKIKTKNTHGTGCTFAAAITAELAKGNTVKEAVQTAKAFIQSAIEDELRLGGGHGPTNHWAYKRRNNSR
ncbi:MAG: bifunctional hydroxymethylpyrimidine kinase/phosphomethylpyrimidine kinase [Desulfitobacterium hafniense]|nr:bifunctional hydroxymethylpyrimidine kinase/phosphomethylpyrimidine kinase [Desulfitobacterium hafniense]